MVTSLARRWWVLAIRGLAAVAFGVLSFVAPGSSIYALVILFGAYAIVDGAFNLGLAFRGAGAVTVASTGRRWGSLIAQGVASIVAGAASLTWPRMSALILLMVIGAWAIVTGVSALVAALRLRDQIRGEWLLALSGMLTTAFGILLFLYPGAGALALVIWIGAYAVVYGGLLVALAFRLRSWAHGSQHTVPTGGGLHVPA